VERARHDETRPSPACGHRPRLAAWLPLQASAGLLDDDEARRAILDLRAKVEAMSREMNARIDTKSDKSAPSDPEPARADDAGNRRLRGQIEVLANQMRTRRSARKTCTPTSTPACASSSRARKPSTARPPRSLPTEQKSPTKPRWRLFKSGDYKAPHRLQDFVRRYPARLRRQRPVLAGQRLLRPARLQERHRRPGRAVSNYGGQPKAPDAMLNIASCYIELKDNKKRQEGAAAAGVEVPGHRRPRHRQGPPGG
jgi:TolA-binding protein